MNAERNDPCPCGSGKKHKKCCGRDNDSAAMNNRQQAAIVPSDDMNRLAALFGARRFAELESSARLLLERYPNSGVVWQVFGIALKAQGKDALHAMQRAVDLMPKDAGAHNNLGTALEGMGRRDDAAASYRRALEIKPDFVEVWNNLGNTLKDLGRLDEAMDSYRRALQIKPDFAEVHNSLGGALLRLDRVGEAEASCRRALEIRPDYAEAYNNLGLALQGLARHGDAVASYGRALEIRPHYAEAHNNLGNALRSLSRFDDAVASFHRALEINPEFAEAHSNLGIVLINLGQMDDAVASCRRAMKIKPDAVTTRSNLLFAMQFASAISAQDLFEAHKRFGEQYEAPLKPHWPAHVNSRDPAKRLKIGYVSGDLREHAVAYFIEPVLAHHDKTQVEVFCYANSRVQDTVTQRLIAVADHWRPCFNMTDDELAQRIGADGIDILVDLSGHTALNRLMTFARKPAPIQITYLGYPGGSGLSAMDYRLTDSYTEPCDDQYYTEELLRLPDSLWCYRPVDGMPEATPLPALTNGYLTFGSFNNCNKIGEACIALWATLLRSLPTARLLMVRVPEGKIRSRLTRQFEEFGVAGERLTFCGKLPAREFHRKLQQVDIALDPFPVNGATTTCESLWQGVPVLTLVGGRFLSRAGLSVLSAAGLPEFAATTQEEYIQTAIKLATDLPGLAEIRAGMRERLKGSPLLDQQRFTRNLEGIYRDVWRRYAAG